MTDYYGLLGVSSTADAAEIETAIEGKYNLWRRLVTHHDSNVADEATRSLRILEDARSTLIDPVRRAHYDRSLNQAGLADPQADRGLDRVSYTPPPVRRPVVDVLPTRVPQAERIDAWVCPQCGAASSIGLQFCRQCGNQIGRMCPNCSSVIETSAPFCPSCGSEIKEVLSSARQQYVVDLQRQMQLLWDDIHRTEQRRGTLAVAIANVEGLVQQYWMYIAGGYAVLFLLSVLVDAGSCLGLLLFLTVVGGLLWFGGRQVIASSASRINARRAQIAQLEDHMRSFQAQGADFD